MTSFPGATHRRPRRRARSALLAAAAALLLAGCDRDVSVGGGDDPLEVEAANAGVDALLRDGRTARRVAAHRLTPERVERWFAAQEALDAQAADDPTLAGPATGLAAGGGDPIERAVDALEERPGAAEAIEDAGLSVEDFVLTGLALHQALTASGPAAPAAVRRLAARNVRFVAEHADLLARFRTQRPAYVAEAEPEMDSLAYYDPFGDSLVYNAAGEVVLPPPDSAVIDTLPPPDSLPPPPDSAGRVPPPPLPVPILPVPPTPRPDTGRPPPPAGVPDSAPPPRGAAGAAGA